jgi:hypothetical protein
MSSKRTLPELRHHAHQRGLASPIWTEQPEHSGPDRERHVVERDHAVGIPVGEVFDLQHCRPRSRRGGSRRALGWKIHIDIQYAGWRVKRIYRKAISCCRTSMKCGVGFIA